MSYRVTLAIIIFLALLITAIYINFFVLPDKTDSGKKSIPIPERQPKNKSETAEKEKSISIPMELPSLNDSDNFIRMNLKPFSDQPLFQKWLDHQDIIRRLVAIVDNIARGEIPPSSLTMLYPEKPFKAIRRGSRIVADPENHRRYTALITLFVSIDTEGIKDLLDRIYPLLEEAYTELGYPEKKFKHTLSQAFRVILDTPVIRSPVFLESRVITYSFLDPKLEALKPVQKLIIRAGPDHTRRIREQCRKIYTQLNLENQ